MISEQDASQTGVTHNGDCKQGTKKDKKPDQGITSIVGQFGLFQLSIASLTFVRYITTALMTNSGPLLAPTLDYWCTLPNSTVTQISRPPNATLESFLKNKCTIPLINGTEYKCSEWTFSLDNGITLTNTFDLVCDRDWLRSAFQSLVSIGVVLASLTWGSLSDRHGRNFVIRAAFLCSLLMGLISCFADNFLVFAVARCLCSFGDIGLVVSLYTIVVELLGSKYRGTVCIIIYTGWAFGVMFLPWVTGYYKNFRHVMLFTVALHVLCLPWLLTLNESVRWLLVNGHIEEARQELKRIRRWNLKSSEAHMKDFDDKFDKLLPKYLDISQRNKLQRETQESEDSRFKIFCRSILGGLDKVGILFQSKALTTTTLTIVWVTFNSELLYMLFILINSDIGDNIELNYAIGGFVEVMATVIGILMISGLTRRFSLSATLLSTSCLCVILAFTHQLPQVSIWLLNMTKLAISTLSSLVYVVTTEIFPTNIRQTGFGLSSTVGSLGAVVAPFIRTELTNIIGMTNVMLILSLLPLTGAIVIPFFLPETKGHELSDDIDEDTESNDKVLDSKNGISVESRELELQPSSIK